MKLSDYLIQHKSELLGQWFDLLIASYPSDATKFFAEKNRQFANPVGYNLNKGLTIIFDCIANGRAVSDELEKEIKEIIKIRAVQDFSPFEAISFIPELKRIILKSLGSSIREPEYLDAYIEFEMILDAITGKAFNIYMDTREMIYEIKANEVKNRTFRMIDRLHKKYDFLDDRIESDEQ